MIVKHNFNITILVIKAASSETLREKADLRMDWVATVELVILHWAIFMHRFKDLDIMGLGEAGHEAKK